jgi:hypothetical protein
MMPGASADEVAATAQYCRCPIYRPGLGLVHRSSPKPRPLDLKEAKGLLAALA